MLRLHFISILRLHVHLISMLFRFVSFHHGLATCHGHRRTAKYVLILFSICFISFQFNSSHHARFCQSFTRLCYQTFILLVPVFVPYLSSTPAEQDRDREQSRTEQSDVNNFLFSHLLPTLTLVVTFLTFLLTEQDRDTEQSRTGQSKGTFARRRRRRRHRRRQWHVVDQSQSDERQSLAGRFNHARFCQSFRTLLLLPNTHSIPSFPLFTRPGVAV
jgi:hypothetical protein